MTIRIRPVGVGLRARLRPRAVPAAICRHCGKLELDHRPFTEGFAYWVAGKCPRFGGPPAASSMHAWLRRRPQTR